MFDCQYFIFNDFPLLATKCICHHKPVRILYLERLKSAMKYLCEFLPPPQFDGIDITFPIVIKAKEELMDLLVKPIERGQS